MDLGDAGRGFALGIMTVHENWHESPFVSAPTLKAAGASSAEGPRHVTENRPTRRAKSDCRISE